MSDTEDFTQLRETMFTALLSDCLDQAGLRGQAMPSRIRPLDEGRVMVGRARTGAYMEVYHVEPGVNPYELEMDLIDSLKPGEIPVFACSNPARVAPWGELLSTAAQLRGAAGAVMDGCVRDIKAIRAMGFSVFHGGIAPLDSKGRARVMAIDVPVECAGVPVASGDLVLRRCGRAGHRAARRGGDGFETGRREAVGRARYLGRVARRQDFARGLRPLRHSLASPPHAPMRWAWNPAAPATSDGAPPAGLEPSLREGGA